MIKTPEEFLPMPAFGWETEERCKMGIQQCQSKAYAYERDYENSVPFLNLSKVVAYIPGINVIVGIARICLFGSLLKDVNETLPCTDADQSEIEIRRFVFGMQVIRGVAEILTGPLLILIDAIKTLYDYVIAKEYLDNQNRYDIV